jgi:hypothetical protein
LPTYSFIDTDTGEEFETLMKISEREEYLKENPQIQPKVTAPSIVSSVAGMGSHRVPDGFKEVLSKVAEKHPNSAVGGAHGKKSIKEVKTQRIVDSLHKKKFGK